MLCDVSHFDCVKSRGNGDHFHSHTVPVPTTNLIFCPISAGFHFPAGIPFSWTWLHVGRVELCVPLGDTSVHNVYTAYIIWCELEMRGNDFHIPIPSHSHDFVPITIPALRKS